MATSIPRLGTAIKIANKKKYNFICLIGLHGKTVTSIYIRLAAQPRFAQVRL